MGLGQGFYEKLVQVSQEVGMKPEDILLIMCSESGLNPHVKNNDSTHGARGLIQIMPQYLINSGFKGTPNQFGALEGVQQLDFIKTFLQGQIKWNGKPFDNPVDYYIGNFFPAALKLPDIQTKNPNAIIVEKNPIVNRYKTVSLQTQIAAYNANTGLDVDKDRRYYL